MPRMAMGTRESEQPTLWVATSDLPTSPGHPFYTRLTTILDGEGFDGFVRVLPDVRDQFGPGRRRKIGRRADDERRLRELQDRHIIVRRVLHRLAVRAGSERSVPGRGRIDQSFLFGSSGPRGPGADVFRFTPTRAFN